MNAVGPEPIGSSNDHLAACATARNSPGMTTRFNDLKADIRRDDREPRSERR
jgi:hypothetical protein